MTTPSSSAADKLLTTLLTFEKRSEQSLSAIATATGLPKSTTHRLLTKLRDYGLVEQDETQHYRLGLRAWRLSLNARPYEGLRRKAHGHLERMSAGTGETAFLTVAEGTHGVCIDRVEGVHNLRFSLDVGSVSPLHLGASNLILLAFSADEQRDAAVRHWVPEAEREELIGQLERIRSEQFVYTVSQLTPGVAALAVPIPIRGGTTIGLSIGGPANRLTRDHALSFLPDLQSTAKEVAGEFDQLNP